MLALVLIGLSAGLYFLHYILFHDMHHIMIYLVGDIAFVPVEVLFVTLIIHQLLAIREKRSLFEKLNMIIGTFFSEVGTRLLAYCSESDRKAGEIRQHIPAKDSWTRKEFRAAALYLKGRTYTVDINKIDLEMLRIFLIERRDFLLRLLENPNLLEHDSFTDLLWAVFHLSEELAYRDDLRTLPQSDYQHLAGDITRAYHSLAIEWVSYMNHLKENYPYLFSLALRTNPFDQSASVIVR